MSQKYEQFLGSQPGMVVELIDSSSSPYKLKSSEGFEFVLSSDDFNRFYRQLGEKTPDRWSSLITDPSTGFIDTKIIVPLMELIHHFEQAFSDFSKARSFLRWAMKNMRENKNTFLEKARLKIDREARSANLISEDDLAQLMNLDPAQEQLLISESCAEIPWPVGKQLDTIDTETGAQPKTKRENTRKETTQKTTKLSVSRMKNVELHIEKNILTIIVDLSQDLGPSKSGRNNIVATTEGNKTIPGREERIGMTVYREIDPKVLKKGGKDTFKNVRMIVEKDTLTMFVDLATEVGPSKSGKNIIIASTGGNQLAPSRHEKIGLNVYRPL